MASGTAIDCDQCHVSADFLRRLLATDPSKRMRRRIRKLLADRCAQCQQPVENHASRRAGDYGCPPDTTWITIGSPRGD